MQDNSNNIKYKKLQPADIEFYEHINSVVTGSNALPFEIPVESFFNLVVRGIKFFWMWHEEATQEMDLYIPRSEIEKAPRVGPNINLKLPNGIEGVYDWKAASGGGYGASVNEMLKINLLQNYSMGGGGTSTDMVAMMFEAASYKEMYTRGITASFNKNNQIFKLRTNIPEGLVIHAAVRLFPEELYGDYLFEEYITALVEAQLGRIITAFDFKLPGNVQINYSEIQSNGQDRKREIEENMKSVSNNDIMMSK